MLWSETRSWAKSKGYETIKDKDGYYWSKIDDINCSGISLLEFSRAVIKSYAY